MYIFTLLIIEQCKKVDGNSSIVATIWPFQKRNQHLSRFHTELCVYPNSASFTDVPKYLLNEKRLTAY